MPRPSDGQTPAEWEAPLDRQAVDRLVVEHLPVALRFAQRLAGDPDTAEDLVQETLCRVLRQWRGYRGDASFRSWMLQIVVNVDRDRRRRHRNTEQLPPEQLPDQLPEPDEAIVADELGERIRREIAHLPDRQREVALLSFGEALTAGQIAEILKITTPNVHTCLHEARKRIAAAIDVEHPKPK